MKVSRRDLLLWSAGAAAGLLVTPVPWKVLDDVSIWSQNWPWIPQPSRGPVEVTQSACTLCPKGCGMSVRMAGGWPVGIAGSSKHPVSRGALCPLGFGAHQLNWHPQRLRQVRHQATASTWERAQAAFTKACSEGAIVVIDGFPGRAASQVLEIFAETHRGSYQVVAGSETLALTPYEAWTGVPASALGYDLDNARTIVSFGAPMLDGWGTPGWFTRLWAERSAGQADPQLRLIQVESTLSRTASKAWQWIPVRVGSESALAAGLARVLLEEKLVQSKGPIPSLTLDETATQTGLSTDAIRNLARTIVAKSPVVVIANSNDPAVAALNVVLGCVGARGGVVRKSKQTERHIPAGGQISSARAVIIDSSVPWEFVPQTDAEVFRFAAWDGGSSKAEWLLPAPGFMEEASDIASLPAVGVDSYSLAAALTRSPHEVHSAAQFLNSLDPALPTPDKLIHERCDKLFRSRAGTLCAEEKTRVAQLTSAQSLEEKLWKGAVWIDDPPNPASLHCEMKVWPTARSLKPEIDSAVWSSAVLPPLASKLYQESALLPLLARRDA